MKSSGASGGVAAGVAMFLVLSGCGTADAPKSAAPNPSPAAQPASSPSGELELGCGSAYTDPIAEVMARGRGSARVAGVILVGVHRSRRWREANGVGVIAKLPLIMREGSEATVSVRGIAGADVAFLTPRQAEVGSAVAEGATRLELFGCQMAGPAGRKPAKYVFYGIYLAASRPGCAELEVTRGGTRASTTVRMRTRTCSTGS